MLCKKLFIDKVQRVILDEADEMLSGGFLENIYQIFTTLSPTIQVGIFSATLPNEILELTKKFMKNPVKITLEAEKLNLEGIQQRFIALSNDDDKFNTLKDLFSKLNVQQTIVYVNSVNRVAELYNAMKNEGYSVCCIHSSMTSADRNDSLNEFRNGKYRVLISSNVTARGIDVQQVSVVINFDIRKCVHNYLHRIGRSGRWGRKGIAINFVTKEDVANMKKIESHYKSSITELPMNFQNTFN